MSQPTVELPHVPPAGQRQRAAARLHHMMQRTGGRPPGSLGRLDELAGQVAGVLERADAPAVVTVLAGDHGVAARGVSALPLGATADVLRLIRAGLAPVNTLARQVGATVHTADFGVATSTGDAPYKIASGTGDISVTDAMSRTQAIHAIHNGARFARAHIPSGAIVAIGEIGVGNTTAAAALTAALTATAVEKVTGPGTGITDDALRRKEHLVRQAVRRLGPGPADPVRALAALGGFEICGNVGIIIDCAARGCCLVLDGYITAVSAVAAARLAPATRDYLVASHRSAEPGHPVLLTELGRRPLLDLEMRLGMASGAALALHLVRAALAVNTARPPGTEATCVQ